MKFLIALSLLLLPFSVAPAGAHGCEAHYPAVGIVAVSAAGETFYVLDAGHVYQESNGVEGPQRGGASDITGDVDECTSDDPGYVPDKHLL